MLSVLTPSELAGIRDIAITRSILERRSPETGVLRGADQHPDDATRAELKTRLAARIAALEAEARSELLALVRLGRGENGVTWTRLVDQSRDAFGDGTADALAADPALDAHIERGLLALQAHPR